MRFSRALAQQYRMKGYLFVAKDTETEAYEIYHQTNEGPYHFIQKEWTKSDAVKEAKRLAMERKLGFNPDIDIVMERRASYSTIRNQKGYY